MNLTIKGLPAKVRDHLKKSARAHGRSMNDEIIQILQEHSAYEDRIEGMRKCQDDLEHFVASLAPMNDSTRLIRADRRRAT